MARELFREHTFRQDALDLIKTCNGIIVNYQSQGLRLTLRQLYYQCVVANVFPNSDKSYNKLGNILSEARLAGIVDWDAIEDRIRQPRQQTEFSNLDRGVDTLLAVYRLRRWDTQPTCVELWVEKDALAGVLTPLAHEFHVTMMVNRGYSSQSAMYDAANRFKENGKPAIIFYLGDLDPSGEDMVRDIEDRLRMFEVDDLTVDKLALTMPQVKQYNPPPNPAKVTDSRYAAFAVKYGASSWEVDALPPNVLNQIIRDAFKTVIDPISMKKVKDKEQRDKQLLKAALEKAKAEGGMDDDEEN